MSFESSPRRTHSGKPVRVDGASRYEVVLELSGWSVIDTLSGLPAASNGRDFVGLRKSDAKDIADELNRCESEGADSPLL